VIDRREILEMSRELSLAPQAVEKDHALGWVLAGIYSHPDLRESWIFKGGTCLKKCYFETYRFSEDLDFTLTEESHLDESFLQKTFAEVSHWVYEQCGMEIPLDTLAFEVYANPRGKNSVAGKVGYRGPLGMRGSIPRIKLDLTCDECVVDQPVWCSVHHPYQDDTDQYMRAFCYSFTELFAEKIRALAERLRPRDLYDVVHLYRHEQGTCDRALVLETLQQKCRFKGIDVPTAESLGSHPGRAELVSEWENMLAHQLPKLPPLDLFDQELPAVFAWLLEARTRPAIPAMAAAADEDSSWRAPSMVTSWGLMAPLETIRYAAATHLCVNLRYKGTERLIEPYSLRRTQQGDILLHAIRHEGGEHRSYRIDRIEAAAATATPFVPRYAVELTPSGTQVIPDQTRTYSGGYRVPSRRRSSAPFNTGGPRYIVECALCGKRFKRKQYSTKLNKHKDKSGYPCMGRTGYLVDTVY
jgi:predicted nucleotidyltransferase component of viral defense system